MLIPNGHIKVKTTSGGGTVNGIPQPVTVVIGSAIECQYRANSRDNFGYVQGSTFTKHDYDILIEKQAFTLKPIQLFDNGGVLIGEFQVKQIEELPHVDLIKLKVAT
jgi:hypothetical protein